MSWILKRRTNEELRALVEACASLTEMMEKLGYKSAGARTNFARALKLRGIEAPSNGKARPRRTWKCSKKRIVTPKWSPENLHLHPKKRADHSMLGRVLLRSGKPYECERCQNDGTWQGERMCLELDHINGDATDQRLDNLRFLCPNCHSLTATYGFRGRKHTKETKVKIAARFNRAIQV